MPEVRGELDVTSQSEVRSLFSKGDYDIIIHTAGTLNAGRVTEISPDDWIRDIEVNAIGTFNLLHYALKRNQKPELFLSPRQRRSTATMIGHHIVSVSTRKLT